MEPGQKRGLSESTGPVRPGSQKLPETPSDLSYPCGLISPRIGLKATWGLAVSLDPAEVRVTLACLENGGN